MEVGRAVNVGHRPTRTAELSPVRCSDDYLDPSYTPGITVPIPHVPAQTKTFASNGRHFAHATGNVLSDQLSKVTSRFVQSMGFCPTLVQIPLVNLRPQPLGLYVQYSQRTDTLGKALKPEVSPNRDGGRSAKYEVSISQKHLRLPNHSSASAHFSLWSLVLTGVWNPFFN